MKMTLILTALISTLLGLNLAFAQSGFNPRDPNLETLDGQYVDQYATPKDDPKTAEAYGDKYSSAPACLECRRWGGGITSNTDPTTAQGAGSGGTSREGTK
jgi:hypothetical protein